MSKNLVIVESPAKAKKIATFLGKDYLVRASVGHVRDLPQKKLGVDIEHGFAPEYVSTARGKKVLSDLKKDAKSCDKVFLAPDPDREGEAIAWHLFEALKKTVPEENFYRVTYNEITKPAILAAFDHPEKINMNRVNSQQARRILDRLVGYVGSPVVRKAVRGANSVGRVQTVALRLVVEREREIRGFNPETYWMVGAQVRKLEQPLDPFTVRLARINNEPVGVKERQLQSGAVRTAEQLQAISDELERSELRVGSVQEKTVQRKARAPFITSTLQQSASGMLGYSPARTMGIAQKLYENGLITYMRTDSFNIAKTAQDECRGFIGEQFGKEYLPEKPNFYKSKGNAQEAHEAIRPTGVQVLPGREEVELEAAEKKLYKLIWERFVASQMAPAQIARRTIEIEAGTENTYLFRATASEIAFPGYMKASGIEAAADRKSSDDDDDSDTETIPPLTAGEKLETLEWLSEERRTNPPARYTEASLIRALEENGVGRPSTYAAIMSKLDEREYVVKEKRALAPTELGDNLIALVDATAEKIRAEHGTDLFEVGFTADMEDRLDKVEEGGVEWSSMLAGFYPSLEQWLGCAKPKADLGHVGKLLDAMEHVSSWAEPVKQGRRVYDDAKTVQEFREKLENGDEISERQEAMLYKIACRYTDQIPQEVCSALELEAPEEPRGETPRKLELFEKVEFEEPRKVGKRTYDDKKFVKSIARQIELGKRLSGKQVAALDRLLVKYAGQIPDFEKIKDELKLEEQSGAENAADETVAPVLQLMEQVGEWKPARGRFDDQKFFNSLKSQFERKGALSEKQVAALKKMAGRYAAAIPDYEEVREQYGLPEPKAKKS